MFDRDEIEKEVTRLQGRCLTEDGKAGIVTDYIIRLLDKQAAHLRMQSDVARRCPACNALLEETSVYCDNCGTDTPRR